MNFLFWNVNGNSNKDKETDINELLKEIIIENKCDIIALAEYNNDINLLLKKLEKEGYNFYESQSIACTKIKVITNIIPQKINTIQDETRYTIKVIPIDNDKIKFLNVVFVHLPDKKNSNDYTRLHQITKIKSNLEEIENNLDNWNSIIVGDFNMNPFETNMVSFLGMNSLNSRKLVKRTPYKIVDKYKHYRFYNPMWNLLGDNNSPEGTYYYNNSDHCWNILDQVVIRPSLIEFFDLKNLKIISSVNKKSLLSKNGLPDKQISDHLPLFFII
ncbi:endonuclease/exonuclease/phosphatase family protein [Paraclostridium bifermentans]|uniref:endonuclease/exonuclease/phosphatase family protein n=1 Tax=Paraclostridium bifermentans TaxID=1490 RepID=UPI003D29EFEE